MGVERVVAAPRSSLFEASHDRSALQVTKRFNISSASIRKGWHFCTTAQEGKEATGGSAWMRRVKWIARRACWVALELRGSASIVCFSNCSSPAQ